MKRKIFILSLIILTSLAGQSQFATYSDLINYINSNIIPNGNRQITGDKANMALRGGFQWVRDNHFDKGLSDQRFAFKNHTHPMDAIAGLIPKLDSIVSVLGQPGVVYGANSGVNKNGNTFQLGGNLLQNTAIGGAYSLTLTPDIVSINSATSARIGRPSTYAEFTGNNANISGVAQINLNAPAINAGGNFRVSNGSYLKLGGIGGEGGITAEDGMMYYNTTLGAFRIRENGVWKGLGGSGGLPAGGVTNQALVKATDNSGDWTIKTINKEFVGLGNVVNLNQTDANNLLLGTIPSGRYGTGTIPISALNIGGTPNGTKVLGDNGTWVAIAGTGEGIVGMTAVDAPGIDFTVNDSATFPELHLALTKEAVQLQNVPNVDATNATNISQGTLSDSRLSANVLKATETYSNPNWLSALHISKISGIGGTPDGTKVLGDDFTWKTVSGGPGGISNGDKGHIIITDDGATFTIDAGVVANQNLANMTGPSVKGRQAGTGAPEDLTPAQLTALLPIASTTAKGLMPQLPNDANLFYNGVGQFVAPPVGSGGVTNGNKVDITVLNDTWTVNAGAINSGKIANNAVTTDKVGNAAITDAKIANMSFSKLLNLPPTVEAHGITNALTLEGNQTVKNKFIDGDSNTLVNLPIPSLSTAGANEGDIVTMVNGNWQPVPGSIAGGGQNIDQVLAVGNLATRNLRMVKDTVGEVGIIIRNTSDDGNAKSILYLQGANLNDYLNFSHTASGSEYGLSSRITSSNNLRIESTDPTSAIQFFTNFAGEDEVPEFAIQGNGKIRINDQYNLPQTLGLPGQTIIVPEEGDDLVWAYTGVGGGPGGILPGSNKRIFYHKDNNLGNEAGFEYNDTTNTFIVPNINASRITSQVLDIVNNSTEMTPPLLNIAGNPDAGNFSTFMPVLVKKNGIHIGQDYAQVAVLGPSNNFYGPSSQRSVLGIGYNHGNGAVALINNGTTGGGYDHTRFELVARVGAGTTMAPVLSVDNTKLNVKALAGATPSPLGVNTAGDLVRMDAPTGSTITAPGANTQIIFNDGNFGADAGLTYNKTQNKLTTDSLVALGFRGNFQRLSNYTEIVGEPDVSEFSVNFPISVAKNGFPIDPALSYFATAAYQPSNSYFTTNGNGTHKGYLFLGYVKQRSSGFLAGGYSGLEFVTMQRPAGSNIYKTQVIVDSLGLRVDALKATGGDKYIGVNANGQIIQMPTPTPGSPGNTGTVTQINTGYGLTGGSITTTGTLVLDTATISNKYTRKADLALGANRVLFNNSSNVLSSDASFIYQSGLLQTDKILTQGLYIAGGPTAITTPLAVHNQGALYQSGIPIRTYVDLSSDGSGLLTNRSFLGYNIGNQALVTINSTLTPSGRGGFQWWGMKGTTGNSAIQKYAELDSATFRHPALGGAVDAYAGLDASGALKRMPNPLTGVPTLQSGNYTPTISGVGISAFTGHTSQYLRIGNVVTVSGSAEYTATLGNTLRFRVALPFSTALADPFQIAGTGTMVDADAGNAQIEDNFLPGSIYGELATNTAIVRFVPNSSGFKRFYYHFTYTITDSAQ